MAEQLNNPNMTVPTGGDRANVAVISDALKALHMELTPDELVPVTLLSGTGYSSAGVVAYRIVGKTCFLHIRLKVDSVKTSLTTLATGVPVPLDNHYYFSTPPLGRSDGRALDAMVTVGGELQVRYGTITQDYYINLVYPIR